MKNKKIVKNKTNGKFYLVEAFYDELYVCYELIAYSPKDYTSANGTPNVITDVVKQHFFDKSDLRYLNSNERFMLNNSQNIYLDNFYQFNHEFCEEYYAEDTYGGNKELLDEENNLWCRRIPKY
jgi:hypothetical protein